VDLVFDQTNFPDQLALVLPKEIDFAGPTQPDFEVVEKNTFVEAFHRPNTNGWTTGWSNPLPVLRQLIRSKVSVECDGDGNRGERMRNDLHAGSGGDSGRK